MYWNYNNIFFLNSLFIVRNKSESQNCCSSVFVDSVMKLLKVGDDQEEKNQTIKILQEDMNTIKGIALNFVKTEINNVTWIHCYVLNKSFNLVMESFFFLTQYHHTFYIFSGEHFKINHILQIEYLLNGSHKKMQVVQEVDNCLHIIKKQILTLYSHCYRTTRLLSHIGNIRVCTVRCSSFSFCEFKAHKDYSIVLFTVGILDKCQNTVAYWE